MTVISDSRKDGSDWSHILRGFTILWINEVAPGHVDTYLEKSKITFPYYVKHGVKLLGCWIGGIGAKSNQVFFLIDYGDQETYNALYSDPEFVAAHQSLDVQHIRSNTGWILNPVDLSPIEFAVT